MEEVPGSQKFFPAQLVFLALGFLGPESPAIKALGVDQDARSNIKTPNKVRPRFYFIFVDACLVAFVCFCDL
jgi:NADPH-dependent glutamate synthase beta subunit-like oxidoreductase